MQIAAKLKQGVTFERIIDDIRDSVSSSFSRIHLTRRKDLSNIQRAFGLRTVEKHREDAISVDIWVEEFKTKN